MKYGREVYGKGDCLYIPEGAYYGPVKPVENGEKLHFADIQFEGPSGIPYPEPEDVVDAQRRLAATGTFEEGVYTFASGRKRDAYEAILEEITGDRISYPKPLLNSYVVLRSNALPWRAHASLPHMGKGAAIPAATPVGHRAVFLLEGNLEFDGNDYDALSYFLLPSGEQHAPLVAAPDATLLIIGWSPLDERVPFDLF
jgi:hypothetical protein